jgi:hypothetical protein
MNLITYHYDTIPDSEIMDHHDQIILGYWEPRSSTDMTLVYGKSATLKPIVDAIHAAGKKVIFQLYAPYGSSSGEYNKIFTDSTRQNTLFDQIVSIINTNNFDGVNFDWECSNQGTDRTKITQTYQNLRGRLGTGKIISVTENYGTVTMLPEVTNYIDWVGLMTYDAGTLPYWYCTVPDLEAEVNRWISAGFNPAKLIPGISLAGRENGSSSSWISYYDIIQTYDPPAVLNVVSSIYYNGVTLVKAKLEKLKSLGCGGAFLYTAGMDTDYTDTRSIVAAAYSILKSEIEPIPEVELMTVTFSGTVSAQAPSGEIVTVTITKPSGGSDTVSGSTGSTGTFTATYDGVAGNGYSAVASIPADSKYQATTSTSVSFDIGLLPRTITLTVG